MRQRLAERKPFSAERQRHDMEVEINAFRHKSEDQQACHDLQHGRWLVDRNSRTASTTSTKPSKRVKATGRHSVASVSITIATSQQIR
jgi:hypothetical protein